MILLCNLHILIFNVSWIWRAFDQEFVGSKLKSLLLLCSLSTVSSIEDDPHVVGRAKFGKLFILDVCHLLLDLC